MQEIVNVFTLNDSFQVSHKTYNSKLQLEMQEKLFECVNTMIEMMMLALKKTKLVSKEFLQRKCSSSAKDTRNHYNLGGGTNYWGTFLGQMKMHRKKKENINVDENGRASNDL